VRIGCFGSIESARNDNPINQFGLNEHLTRSERINMTVFVVGASGATGQRVVEQLLDRGQYVKAVVRGAERLPETLRHHANLSLVEASILELSDMEILEHLSGCNAVVSCLGHNLTLKGLFGQPRGLVTDATRRLCDAIKAHPTGEPKKFVLMNTAGNSNRDLNETISISQGIVIRLLRLCLPPHVDNENAADYLRTEIGQKHEAVEWSVVRPDSLINEDMVTEYDEHGSPTRSAIFNPGVTSRINVADIMTNLVVDEAKWAEWKGRMPVIYNEPSPSSSTAT
jgi:hypothetical protein